MNECNIVRDLMPLCADELASGDTVEYIRRHTEACPECRAAWERYQQELPQVKMPEQEKKTIKALRRSMVWMILKGVLIFTAGLGIFIGLIYYGLWEAGYAPIQKAFYSEDPNYEVYTVDWDTAGFFETGEGSIVTIQCGNSSFRTLLPWDDLDVVWAPNGADAMLIIQTVEGKLEYRILAMNYTRDEEAKKSMGSTQFIPRSGKPDLQAVLTEKCKAHPEFPGGWTEITFTFTQWEPDSETVTFHFTTDTGNTGFLSYHFPSETITKLYQ